MQTNDGCHGGGFCFWGIYENRSLFSEAVAQLSVFAKTTPVENNSGSPHYIESFGYSDKKIVVSLDFVDNHGLVSQMYVSINGIGRTDVPGTTWAAFRPSNYLRSYGIPKDIFIEMSEGPEGRFSYYLILDYEGWYVEYAGSEYGMMPNNILACPNKEHNIERIELVSDLFGQKTIHSDWRVEQSKLTGMTNEDFFQLLLGDPDNSCFELNHEKYISFVLE